MKFKFSGASFKSGFWHRLRGRASWQNQVFTVKKLEAGVQWLNGNGLLAAITTFLFPTRYTIH